MKTAFRIGRARAALAFCVLAFCLPPPAAFGTELVTPAQITLPPDAQAEFDQGLAAAELQAWPIAIKHFDAAEEKLRYSSGPQFYAPLYFNLGLAHDKAGHELAAIAWFWRYLGTAPDADNAAAVRKEIVSLKVRAEVKIIKLLDAERQLDPGGIVSFAYAEYGDIQSALSLSDKNMHDYMQLQYAEGAAERGEFEEAENTVRDLWRVEKSELRLVPHHPLCQHAWR